MTARTAAALAARQATAPAPRKFINISTLFLESLGAPAGATADVHVGEVEAAFRPAVDAGLVAMPANVTRAAAANTALGAFPNPEPPVPWDAITLDSGPQRDAMLDRAAMILYGDAARGEAGSGALDWFIGEWDRLPALR